MDTPYFIKEHLWMRASGEATLKFPTWERQTFPQKNFLSQKNIPIIATATARIGKYIFFYSKCFSVHSFARF